MSARLSREASRTLSGVWVRAGGGVLIAVVLVAACGGSNGSTAAHRVDSIARPDVYVFMKVNTPRASIAAIEQRVRRSRTVESFAYVSPSDAYDEFMKSNAPDDVKAATNYFDLPASFTLRLHHPSRRREVSAQFRGLRDVDLTRAGFTCASVRSHARREFMGGSKRDALRQCLGP